jgi:hypothetical protein
MTNYWMGKRDPLSDVKACLCSICLLNSSLNLTDQ